MTNNVAINAELKEELFEKYRKKPVVVSAYQTDVELDIETLEGTMRADPGDYIIKGIKGEPYPCKPDIFVATYEKADKPKTINDYLKEWEDSINELDNKAKDLINLKETYNQMEQEIIDNTDFKELYGANNQKVRDNHVKNELKDMVDDKNKLELRIDYLKRRIDFIKSVVKIKSVAYNTGGAVNEKI